MMKTNQSIAPSQQNNHWPNKEIAVNKTVELLFFDYFIY